MNLREETRDIIENRPSRAERHARDAEAKEKARRRRQRGKGGVFPKRKPYAVIVLLMGLAAAGALAALILVDAFPADLTFILIAIMFGMLIVTSVLMARPARWKRVSGICVALIFLLIFGSVTYYLGASYAMMSKISGSESFSNAEDHDAVIDVTEEPFNVYITGIDQWEDEKGEDLERSDVNMIVTVNPVTKKILLTSIPRDSYVKLHSTGEMDKLTHTGIYGVDETLNTVSDWLGLDFNYYVKMNFTAVVQIIDALGGIKVYSPVAFESSLKGYKYKKGWNYLGGYKALYFARERHAFEGQDEVRVENQQRVMKAMIKKLTSSTALMTHYGDVMAAAGDNLHTDMSYKEIQSLVKMQMTDLASWDVQSQKIEGEDDMDYVASLSSKQKYYIYRPSDESVSAALKGIDEVMNPSDEELEAARKNRSRSFIANMIRKLLNRDEESK